VAVAVENILAELLEQVEQAAVAQELLLELQQTDQLILAAVAVVQETQAVAMAVQVLLFFLTQVLRPILQLLAAV
jgi:hypothetical protein